MDPRQSPLPQVAFLARLVRFFVAITLVFSISPTNNFFYSMVLASRPGLLRTRAPEPADSFVPKELRMGEVAPVLHT